MSLTNVQCYIIQCLAKSIYSHVIYISLMYLAITKAEKSRHLFGIITSTVLFIFSEKVKLCD